MYTILTSFDILTPYSRRILERRPQSNNLRQPSKSGVVLNSSISRKGYAFFIQQLVNRSVVSVSYILIGSNFCQSP